VNSSAIAGSLAAAFSLIVPEAVLLFTACVLFVGTTFRANRHLWGTVALIGLAAAGVATWVTAARVPTIERRQELLVEDRENLAEVRTTLFTSPILLSRLAVLTRIMALVAGAVLVLFSWNEVSDRHAAEYQACLLIVVIGVALTGLANDLVTLFLALEFISIPTYVILYLQRTDRPAQEAAAKYFLLSVFASALLLFGFSYLYGMAGTTNIPALLNGLTHDTPLQPDLPRDPNQLPLLSLVALMMVVAGLGFKITAVPFHFYAPDVYQGTTPSVAAILAFMPKAAGFIALIRVLGFVRPEDTLDLLLGQRVPAPGLALGSQVPILLFILSVLTMSVGNVLALLQDNVKRLLAYSSVAHAGYMLIGLAVAPDLSYAPTRQIGNPATGGVEAVLFYLVAYGAMTVGAFAILAYLSTPERPVETVDDLAGLSDSHRGAAIVMALFLFSLIGIPMTAGFAGKFFLFFGALAVPNEKQLADHVVLFRWLALIGAINAAVAAWYYLRIIMAMFLRTPIKPIEKARTWPISVALGACVVLTVLFGIDPEPLKAAARAAVFPERPAEPQVLSRNR
jgi:NADH-quinone oxidoreductase subunit N